jgi:hypothetical protein
MSERNNNPFDLAKNHHVILDKKYKVQIVDFTPNFLFATVKNIGEDKEGWQVMTNRLLPTHGGCVKLELLPANEFKIGNPIIINNLLYVMKEVEGEGLTLDDIVYPFNRSHLSEEEVKQFGYQLFSKINFEGEPPMLLDLESHYFFLHKQKYEQ